MEHDPQAVDDAFLGEPMTLRYDQHSGEEALVPAFFPMASVLVKRVGGGGRWMAALSVGFSDGGWGVVGAGSTPRAACIDLESRMKAIPKDSAVEFI